MKKIIVFLLLVSVLIIGCEQKEVECRVNADCVAATCCHADACVAKEKAPNCEGIFCSMECKPYTMDCGQGRCICRNNICAAEITN
ncbi:hypothetical protein KY343_06365 [Candidatus Woesearchaeota archaeon]|nr:hypothetical protein [Candidatus Woesearchaeota archaeon]